MWDGTRIACLSEGYGEAGVLWSVAMSHGNVGRKVGGLERERGAWIFVEAKRVRTVLPIVPI